MVRFSLPSSRKSSQFAVGKPIYKITGSKSATTRTKEYLNRSPLSKWSMPKTINEIAMHGTARDCTGLSSVRAWPRLDLLYFCIIMTLSNDPKFV